jgi:hypothetical protein
MKIERGVPLVERVIERVAPHVKCVGAGEEHLDALESALMVEIPPTLRRWLQFDFTFKGFGPRWRGRARFGPDPRHVQPRVTSVTKLAEAMIDFGWTRDRVRHKVIRLPNLPDDPWNCLYLGEARRDGELPILGLVNDETTVAVYVRYTSFDSYLVEQSGLLELSESDRLDDLETMLSLNPELSLLIPEEEPAGDY